MKVEKFKSFVKAERPKKMLSAFELTYLSFTELGYDQKDKQFFIDNASQIVKEMRNESWKQFLKDESNFSKHIYRELVHESDLSNLNKEDAIIQFLEEYEQHIYALSLSNTQSRRSRAGNEFEYIIEFILMGIGISLDTQGSVGSGVFETSHLAKLVDCVAPGATEYKLDKRNTSLISAKTTLRERWQEVGDEMSRTQAREMYLATLDDSITDNVTNIIGKNNIILVTLEEYKNDLYKHSPNVISFETMIEELLAKESIWNNYTYSEEDRNEKKERYEEQIDKNSDKPFIVNYYKDRIRKI